MPKSLQPMGDFEDLLLQSLSLKSPVISESTSRELLSDINASCRSSLESVYPSDEEIFLSYSCSDPCSVIQQQDHQTETDFKRYERFTVSDNCPFVGRLTEKVLERHRLWCDREPTLANGFGAHFNATLDIFDQRRALTPSPRRRTRQMFEGKFSANNSPAASPSRRINSLKTKNFPQEESCLQRVRNFSTSSKGIIHRGDSQRCISSGRRSLDDGNISSSQSTCSSSSSKLSSSGDSTSSSTSSQNISHKIVLVGANTVGKQTLARQLITPESMGLMDSHQGRRSESSVAVRLDWKETILNFLTITPDQDILWHDDASAYLVLYSVSDLSSFNYASKVLEDIREMLPKKSIVIIVATKADIVRNRQISYSDGKKLATKYKCKYIEVSTVLNHKVDDLLVGIVSQIRLSRKLSKKDVMSDHPESSFVHKVHKATQGLSKVLRKYPWYFCSCDNLLVL